MGMTGVGKSTFISRLTGHDQVGVGHGLMSSKLPRVIQHIFTASQQDRLYDSIITTAWSLASAGS